MADLLKFSPANAKTKALREVADLAPYLANKRKIYSLDLLSGYSCPFADKCLSKAVRGSDGKTTIKDGPNTEFRCFSASQEALYPNVYDARKHNFDLLRKSDDKVKLLNDSLPKNAGIIRIHVAGDFFNQSYFDAWLSIAQSNPDKLFYAYTKSLGYWLARRREVTRTKNFVLTASYGGRLDNLISKRKLRYAKVVYSVDAAGKLEIDKTDECAANPNTQQDSFALLIHGVQPKGSEAAAGLKALKGVGSYQR